MAKCLNKPIYDGRQRRAIFNAEPRGVCIKMFDDGFVPNSYRWPAPGKGTVYYRDGTSAEFEYDRKRPRGRGPSWILLSEKGGRLASY